MIWRMHAHTKHFNSIVLHFLSGLRGVKRELLQSLTKCKSKSCKEILEKYEIGKLDMNGIDYDQVNWLSLLLDEIYLTISIVIDETAYITIYICCTYKSPRSTIIDSRTKHISKHHEIIKSNLFFFHSEHHHINHHYFSYFSLSISCEDVRQVFSKGMCVLNTVLIFECDIHFLSICCLAPVHHSIALY